MQKDKNINGLLLLLSLLGAAAAYVAGELILYFLSFLPDYWQTGIYLAVALLVGGGVLLLAESIRSGGYVLNWRSLFFADSLKAMFICVAAALVIGMLTQFLYGFAGASIAKRNVHFQGTMLVSDISTSMLDHDVDYGAVAAMCEYIDTVPLGEFLGVMVYNHTYDTLRPYTILETEEERTALKEQLRADIQYGGNTDTQSALLDGIRQVRTAEGDYPGLILLFSDGQSDLYYNSVQAAARGDVENSGDQIPVNTIYYASDAAGGYQMSHIAQITGGTYYFLNDKITIKDVFTKSRSLYTVEKPHLLQACFGDLRHNPLRIILQTVLLALWGIIAGLMVTGMLDNKYLINVFLWPRIALSIVLSAAFALAMAFSPMDYAAWLRIIPVLMIMIMPLPTYEMK